MSLWLATFPGILFSGLGLLLYSIASIRYDPDRPLLVDQTRAVTSAMMLIGFVLIGQWLWQLPFQMDQGGEVLGPIIYGCVPIAVLAALFACGRACLALREPRC